MPGPRLSQPLIKANSTGLLPYLLPFLHDTHSLAALPSSRAPFSTTQRLHKRRDNNPMRGLSAIRSTGLPRRFAPSVHAEPLPRPVLGRNRQEQVEYVTPEDHGLWAFFGKERRCMTTPEEENSHGREWTTAELRIKTFEDLHRLWWVCAKERNRIATNQAERERLKAGYGKFEASERDKVVRKTMENIRWCLIERWYAYQDARELAQNDPEVILDGSGPAYTPQAYEEDEAFEEEDEASEKNQLAAAEGQSDKPIEESDKEGKTTVIPPAASSTEQRASL